ncbi:MAG: XdhC/CoxI family protein [Candidatus Eisenbacteria bacterium]
MALRLKDLYAEIARMHREGVPGVVATVVAVQGSTPRSAGAKMIVYADGRSLGSVGGGAIESVVIEMGKELAGSRDARLASFDLDEDTGMACGGKMDILIEPVSAGPEVVVIGGGHVGQAVASVAKRAGFRVTVIDDRADMVTEERFPSTDRRFVGGVELLEDDVTVDGSTFVVVVTRGHRFDSEWVKALMPCEPLYIGMIGSEQKVGMTFDGMRSEGVPDRVLASIHAPIGLDIGAETPDEIAVSVVAEIIAVRHGITDTAMLKDKPEHKGRNR